MARRKPLTEWRTKLHPAFFEVSEINKRFELEHARLERKCAADLKQLRKDDSRRVERASRFKEGDQRLLERCEKQLDLVQQRYPNISHNPVAYSYLYGASEEPEPGESTFVRFVHWLRHREHLDAAGMQDAQGSLPAYHRLTRTFEDVRRVLQRLGLVKPFKGDIVHRQFLELIICYENPQTPLTADERAACADAYCGCGRKIHDADALKKQYARLKRELKAAYRAQ